MWTSLRQTHPEDEIALDGLTLVVQDSEQKRQGLLHQLQDQDNRVQELEQAVSTLTLLQDQTVEVNLNMPFVRKHQTQKSKRLLKKELKRKCLPLAAFVEPGIVYRKQYICNEHMQRLKVCIYA